MFYYSYSEENNEYTGGGIAQIDPLESEKQKKEIYLLPNHVTFVKTHE